MSYKCEMCDNWATRWALCDHCYAYMNHPSYQATLKEYLGYENEQNNTQ